MDSPIVTSPELIHTTCGIRPAAIASGAAFESVPCLLCGGAQAEELVRGMDDHSGAEFAVVRCSSCGLAFTNPRPIAACIGQYYSAGYEPHRGHAPRTGWRIRWQGRLERAVLRGYYDYPPRPVDCGTMVLAALGRSLIRSRRRRAEWVPYQEPGRLLDFGCGAGGFGLRMREYGWSVEGIELDAEVAARVEQTHGLRVHVGSLPHADIAPASFDAVTMWSSLEHVHDPLQVVRAAYEVLRPGGSLVVYVPNLDSWAFRTFRGAWFGLDLPRHLVHFTPDTLRELLGRAGFEVKSIDHVGRDGWLRHSVQRARAAGAVPAWIRAFDWKPAALACCRWTERTGQADSILALAERLES